MTQYRLRSVNGLRYEDVREFCKGNDIPFSTEIPLTEEQAMILKLKFNARVALWDDKTGLPWLNNSGKPAYKLSK